MLAWLQWRVIGEPMQRGKHELSMTEGMTGWLTGTPSPGGPAWISSRDSACPQPGRRGLLDCSSTRFDSASDEPNPGRRSVPLGPQTRTYVAPHVPNSVRRRSGFPSTFPPTDAEPRGTGRDGRGRRGTAEAVDRPFVHVTGDDPDQVGTVGDPRGDGGATCKIAGIAYTGSNPVPATLSLSCGNAAAA
jgi:hypothetical protein